MSDPNEVIEQQLRAERPWAAVKLAQARIADAQGGEGNE